MTAGEPDDPGTGRLRRPAGCSRRCRPRLEAADQVVTGTAGGGVVSVEMTGGGEVRSVTLSDVVDPDDVEMLQDLIVAALHGRCQVTELQRQALGGLGDLLGGMPGLPGLPGPGESPRWRSTRVSRT